MSVMKGDPVLDRLGNELKFGDLCMVHYRNSWEPGIVVFMGNCKNLDSLYESTMCRTMSLNLLSDENYLVHLFGKNRKIFFDEESVTPSYCFKMINTALIKIGEIDFKNKTITPTLVDCAKIVHNLKAIDINEVFTYANN